MGSLLIVAHRALPCCYAHPSIQLVRGDPRIDYTSVAATGTLCSRWEGRTVHLKSLHQQLRSRCCFKGLPQQLVPIPPVVNIQRFQYVFFFLCPILLLLSTITLLGRAYAVVLALSIFRALHSPSMSWLSNATPWSLCSLLFTPCHAMYSRKSTSTAAHAVV